MATNGELHRLDLPGSAPAGSFDHGEILFIGTATVLVTFGGFTVLTDPNFLHRGQHAKLGYGLRSRRLTDPAVELGDLPPLDLVVLSHHHGDHFDEVAAAGLDPALPIVTTAHAARKLERQGFRRPAPLDTWQWATASRPGATLRVTSLPARHGPLAVNRGLPPVMGSMLDFADADGLALRMYISGDTLMYDDLREIPRRFPDVDIALVHLGGTRVLGVLLTMDGRQGREVVELVDPRTAIPIHFDDYTVFRSPLSDFREEMARSPLSDRVEYLQRGDRYRFPVDRRR